MRELDYPFDTETIIRRKKKLKKALMSNDREWIEKRIAILGGVTTQDVKDFLELFLLNYGIKPSFYESEYNQYYEDGIFPNEKLQAFKPDIIYICTSIRNIIEFPRPTYSEDTVAGLRKGVIERFSGLWNAISDRYHCPIIQNNFEYPYFRLLGNMDAYDPRGRVNFISEINREFCRYAREHNSFFICDINYLSASFGLDKWSDPYYWHMYKYATAISAIPYLSYNVANIIKSIYGKNKKAFNLDLDNTLWGGIIGEDGVDNIEIGQETSLAQTYSEFQEYLKLHKELGILLTVNSKNDMDNALSGFDRPDSILHRDDFASFKANWNPKSENLGELAGELNLLPESFVFVDDNPAEREIIFQQFSGAGVPVLDTPEHYIKNIDRSGFFEVTSLSEDDLSRTKMYEDNAKRTQAQATFTDYGEYLKSLDMTAEIQTFVPTYMSRIAQLTNKSNQFNLTTKRYSQNEIEAVAEDSNHLCLYGKLNDKFGDNGVVSVVIGEIRGAKADELHMELWIMSCRVLKREMEFAMMDELARECRDRGIKSIYGYYFPTQKNGMVKDFYAIQGFDKVSEDDEGKTVWKFEINDSYQKKQEVIRINGRGN